MIKKIVAIIFILGIMASLSPMVSHAVITPYFMAINDTLLPFNADTMPFVSGGEVFVPARVLEGVEVYAIGSDQAERLRLYSDASVYIDFYTARGVTEDHNGNTLQWPSARRVGRRFYVPLRQVCDFFDLTYRVFDVPRDVIPNEHVRVVRIMTRGGFNFNDPTFIGINERAMRTAYNDYYAPPPTPPPSPTGGAEPPPPIVEPPPNYSDVTIYLSFYDVSAGSAEAILDLFDIRAESGYGVCFFVNAADITENQGLIRRISGTGHSIGLWLTDGTFEEYTNASALLFEAAKVKTVIVSADSETESAVDMAASHGLIYWESSQGYVDSTLPLAAITEMIPEESGARQNLVFSCSENAASILYRVYSFLRENEYSIARITETVEPLL